MISDEPDEDAAALDDETAFDAYLSDAPTRPNGGAKDAPYLPDWPPMAAREVDLNLDGETLAWFRAAHPDWRRAMRLVLRGWVAAKTMARQPIPQTTDTAHGGPDDRP